MVVGSEVFEGLDHHEVIFIAESFGPSDMAGNGGSEDDDDAKVLDVKNDAMDEQKLNTNPAAEEEKKLYAHPAAEMGGGMEGVMEMDEEEVCREILLEDGDNDDDDDMNEVRNGMDDIFTDDNLNDEENEDAEEDNDGLDDNDYKDDREEMAEEEGTEVDNDN